MKESSVFIYDIVMYDCNVRARNNMRLFMYASLKCACPSQKMTGYFVSEKGAMATPFSGPCCTMF